MIETILGGLLGGLFRLAPEVIKLLDAKNERAHELAMQDKALEYQKLTGQQKMAEIGASADAAWNAGSLSALAESIKAQATRSGVAWVDALSTSVRPIITYWFMALYCGAKISGFAAALNGGAVWSVAFSYAWTPADMALWAGILNFWFLGRVFDRVR
jgi:hypothetical protein